jgi:hypothetical protein
MSRRFFVQLPSALALVIALSATPITHAQDGAPAPLAEAPLAPAAPPPPPAATPAPQPPPAQGQWIDTPDYGWIWIPAGATAYAVGGVPSVYLYTPAYGWTWYASPWGWGPYVRGPWIGHPGPFGFRVWMPGAHAWYSRGGPRVDVNVWGHAGRGYYRHHGGPHYGGNHGGWGGHGRR